MVELLGNISSLLFTQIHVFDNCSYSTFPFFYILATVSQLQTYDAVVWIKQQCVKKVNFIVKMTSIHSKSFLT